MSVAEESTLALLRKTKKINNLLDKFCPDINQSQFQIISSTNYNTGAKNKNSENFVLFHTSFSLVTHFATTYKDN